MRSPQGNDVGRPNSSWLNQFPQRPMAWARGMAGAAASRRAEVSMPHRRATHTPTTAPTATPPQMPSPPSQILRAPRGSSVYSW
ncbi:MAG TPA: hypothetical protein VHF24_08825 [Acidimicrobiales bacterium]|nr:hypothetical protein [Acidimicrobiales bacterium]